MNYQKTIQNRIQKNKNKMLEFLIENNGNVCDSCDELGIHRSTFYRWLEKDKEFREKAEKIIFKGRKFKGDETLYDLWKYLKMLS